MRRTALQQAITAATEEVDTDLLFAQTYVDQARLIGNINAVLPPRSTALLSDIVTLYPIEQGAAGWVLAAGAERQLFELPGFDAASPQQLRLRKRGDRLEIWWEARWLGEIAVPAEATQVGLYAHLAAAAFDMVRVTAL